MLARVNTKPRRQNDPAITCEHCARVVRFSEQTTYNGRPSFLKRKYCSKRCEGDARSMPLDVMFERDVIRQDGCWGWSGGFNTSGYAILRKNVGDVGAHRYSYERAHGPIPPGLFVMHSCDNPACSNPDHLSVGTPKQNTHDMIGKRRHCFGEAHPSSKLTDVEVSTIRASSEPLKTLAERYGCAESQISRIRNGKSRREASNA